MMESRHIRPLPSSCRCITGKERRGQLLDIGRRLLAVRGLDSTSIEEIAANADVSKPVVYEHFGGKEGLYAVVVDREVERFLTMATRLLDGEDTMAKFEIAAVHLLRYIEENSDGFRILVRDSNPTSGSGTFAGLISDIASQVEYILGDVLKNYARLADAQGLGDGRAEAVAGSGNLRGLSGWRATRWGPSYSIGPGHHLAATMVILRRFLGSCPGSCDHAELGQHARHPCPYGPYGQQEQTPTR
jgi:AcrR family transcriptional regulator